VKREKNISLLVVSCLILIGAFLWYAIITFPVVRAIFVAMLLIDAFLFYRDKIREQKKAR
jgi:hypothetical protein